MTSLADEIRDVRFTPVRIQNGYVTHEADQLLDDLAASASVSDSGSSMEDLARIVSRATLGLSVGWLREGYSIAEVDEFLIRIAGVAPAKRSAPAPSVSTPSPAVPTQVAPSVISERPGWWARVFGRG